jgi:hypothetical protein
VYASRCITASSVSVNVAARLVAEAERHQVLVTAAVRNEAGSPPNAEFVPLGRRRLRGLFDEVELFAAVERDAGVAAPIWIDPVCSMELTVDQVAARLSRGGKEQLVRNETRQLKARRRTLHPGILPPQSSRDGRLEPHVIAPDDDVLFTRRATTGSSRTPRPC